MLYGILNTCLKAFSPLWKPLFQLLKLDEGLGAADSGGCWWCAPFPFAPFEWTQAPGQVEQSHHAHAACGWPSLRTCNMSFLYGCQLGSWLKVFSGSKKVERVWERWQNHLLLSLRKKQNRCATGWHNDAICIAMKMSTTTAGSAAWGGGEDLLETTWGMGTQNQCSGTGTAESTVPQITSKSAFWEN